MTNLNKEHREEAAVLGLAEFLYELTGYPEEACKRMARGLLAMASKGYDTSEDF